MKLKKIMAMVLCIAMVLSTMSFSVFAEEDKTENVTKEQVTVNAYVAQDTVVNGWTTIWGQLTINGTTNFYVELYSGETYLGKTTLVDTEKVLLVGENKDVTWHAFIDGSDPWWNTEWTVIPVSNLAPTDVKYYVDNALVGTGKVKMSSADDLNPVVWEELRGVAPAVPEAGTVEVTTYEELISALAKDNANVKMLNDITATATQNSGYGVAGIVVEAGDILDGNGYTLTINGANNTWDCAIAMKGGEVKNLTVSGAMRGIFMPAANGDVVIDNCIFKDVIYTFNSDSGSKDYSVTVKNSILNGWTSFSNVHKSVTFENCTFGEGSGYQFCRPYQPTTFTDCEFNKGFEFDTSKVEDNSLTFNQCTYDGVALSSDNNAMFYNGGSVLIDGVPTNVTQYAAKIGDNKFATLEEAFKNATADCTIDILSDITISEAWDCRYNGAKFTVPVTINGNGHTLSLTGTVDDKNWNTVFRFEAVATVKNLTIDASKATSIQRGISAKSNIVVENCTLIGNGTSAKRAVIYGEGAGTAESEVTAAISDSTFKDWSYGVSDSQSGRDSKSVSVTDSVFTNASVLLSAEETVTFKGNKVSDGYVNITSYTASDTAVVNATSNTLAGTDNEITVNPENITADEIFITPVAKIGSKYYETLTKAISRAKENEVVTVVADITLNEPVEVNGIVTLELNGKTITGTDNNTSGSYGLINIQPGAELTINDTVGTGKITLTATTDRDWNAYSSVISNQRGKLTVNGGTIEHLGGTDMAYAIDNLTNGKGTYAETVIEGGTIKSTYRAIRQFLNGTEAQNILTVNGGTIEGTNKSIWMQDPSKNANSGTLTVSENAALNGDVYLYVTAGSTEWPVEVSIAKSALKGESEVLTGNVPDGYDVVEYNGIYGVVEIPKLPTATVTELENEELTFALNFKADEVSDEQSEYYGNWYADYVLTVNKDITFNANGGADGYLSGQYDAWNENWVNVPFEDVTLKAGESIKIMEYAAELMNQSGLKLTYNDVLSFVKDFNCGIFLEPEFISKNPDLKITLELRMFNPKDETISYVIGETYEFTAPVTKPEILENSLYITYSQLGKFDFGYGETDSIKLSLFAGVDSLNYSEVGFDVTVDGITQTFKTRTVYGSVKTMYNGEVKTFKASEFGNGINHIFGQTIHFPATSDFENVEVKWTPYAIKDGKKITINTFTLSDVFPGTLGGEK